MTRRQKIGIGLVLLGILILLALLLYPRSQPTVTPVATVPSEQVGTTPQPQQQIPEQPNVPTSQPVEQPEVQPTPADGRTSLVRLAASFAERYGSYSNHNDFENLSDLTVLMNGPLAAQTRAYIEEQTAGGALPDYVGVSSRALKSEVVDYDENAGQAKITVSVQRIFSDDRLVFQDLHLKFVKSGDSWLVSDAEWDENQENAR